MDDVLAPPATDDAIWAFAAANGLTIVSKDADFAARAAREQGVQVVWVRCGNLKLATFRVWFDARAEAMRRLVGMDERVIELR